MKRRVLLLLLALACPTALAADARLGNGVFEPAVLRVEPGETVTWTNEDGRAHTVTSSWDDGATFNEVLRPGESFTFTFPEAGTFDVHCVPHVTREGGHYEGMVMRVEVAHAAAPPAEASPDRALLLVGAGGLAVLAVGFVVLQRRGLRV